MLKNGQTAAALVKVDPEKQQRIQAELDLLREIFHEVDENKRDFVQRQIEQLAWFNVSIADLQLKVDQWGTLVTYDNGGGQTGVKPNPDVKTLLDYQKSCNTIVRTLIPLVPNKMDSGKLGDFLSFDYDQEDDEERDRRDREHTERINAEIERAIQMQREQRERATNGKV